MKLIRSILPGYSKLASKDQYFDQIPVKYLLEIQRKMYWINLVYYLILPVIISSTFQEFGVYSLLKG